MNWHETPLVFDCEGERLIGIATQPDQPADTGVVIVVGGPQYRAGSHRQFTLLARRLASDGYASFRFDYRGMGDSEGEFRNFEDINADIASAIGALMKQVPKIQRVVLWGLCDAASAILYYGHQDPRVNGLVLLNPWVHSEVGAARARLKHYYLRRLLSKSFWYKLLTGKVRVGESIGGLAEARRLAGTSPSPHDASPFDPRHGSPGNVDRMLMGLKAFRGKVQVVLSGNDFTAQEFTELMNRDGDGGRPSRTVKSEQPMFNQQTTHSLHVLGGMMQRLSLPNLSWVFEMTSRKSLLFILVCVASYGFVRHGNANDGLTDLRTRHLMLLPDYCKGARSYNEIVKMPRSAVDQYYKTYGNSWDHMHHYCDALIGEFEGDRILEKGPRRNKYNSAIGNIDYVFNKKPPVTFHFLAEMYAARARILFKMDRPGEAVADLIKATNFRPIYLPAFAQLSDYYSKSGKKEKAVSVLEEGVANHPSPSLLLRKLEKLGKPYQGIPGNALASRNDAKSIENQAATAKADTASQVASPVPGDTVPAANGAMEPRGTAATQRPAEENAGNPYCRFCP